MISLYSLSLIWIKDISQIKKNMHLIDLKKKVPRFYESNCCCSVTQYCLNFCNPIDFSMPGFPVLHRLPELAQTHIHWVGDAMQPSCPPVFSLSQSRVFPNESALCIKWSSIGTSTSASLLPMNSQGWFPLGLTGLISLQSKGLSRVFSNTTVQKHQFFGAQPTLWSNSYIHTRLLDCHLPNSPV